MASHVSEKCLMTVVLCPYSEAGCPFEVMKWTCGNLLTAGDSTSAYHVGSPVTINTNQKPENSGTQGNDRFYEQVEADEAVFCLVCHSSMVKPNDDKIWNAAHTTNLRDIANTLRKRTAISPRQWQPWTVVSSWPCWWVVRRTKQLSMAAITRVIWLCACVRHWPYRGAGSVCFSAYFGLC